MTGASTVERTVARVLLSGGLLSVSLMLAGLVIYAAQGQPHVREVVRVVRNRQAGLAVDVFTSLHDVRRALAQWPIDALAVSTLGLLGLLATPVVGVSAAAISFWRHGDRQYTLVAVVVLAMLLVSLVLAGAG